MLDVGGQASHEPRTTELRGRESEEGCKMGRGGEGKCENGGGGGGEGGVLSKIYDP